MEAGTYPKDYLRFGDTMNYKELLRGCKKFVKNEPRDSKYLIALKHVNRGQSSLECKLVGCLLFLLSWNVARRHIYNESEFDSRFAETLKNTMPYINSLKDESWTHIDWNKRMKIADEQLTVKEVFLKLYREFSYPEGKELCGDVGTVKVLHLFNPDFFSMWDNLMLENKELKEDIRRRKIKKSAEGYIRWTTWMSEEAREIISSIKEEHGINENEVVRFLQNEYLNLDEYEAKVPKSLPKMLDEYFYARYSRRWYRP